MSQTKGDVLNRPCKCGFFIIYLGEILIFFNKKIRHMKKAHSAGNAGLTILLAIGFLGLVMFLSYMFITGTMK